MINRTYWWIEKLDTDYGVREVRHRTNPDDATLISSKLDNGQHAPALDIDVPHGYFPSSTPGHGHLFIDVPMSWWRYRRLLKQLYKAGIIQHGFYRLSIRRRGTFLRKPGLLKEVK